MIYIKELNISEKRGTLKKSVNQVEIDEAGIVGDAHRGKWHRQITLLTENSLNKFSQKHKRECKSFEFATNLYVTGLDIKDISLFDKFQIGDVLLEVTQIGKKPHNYDSPIMREIGESIMFTEGVFCRVINGGSVKLTDKVIHTKKILKTKIITLSDRAFSGEYEDLSGPKIAEILQNHFKETRWNIQIDRVVIPDEEENLKSELNKAIIANTDFIFTTGGTGIGPRDITVEVVSEMADKLIPGIMDWIRIKYGSKKPNALLSRSIACTMKNSLVYTLPGSVKAVTEYTETILETAEHLLLMLHGIGH